MSGVFDTYFKNTKCALVRVDFNIPLGDDGVPTDLHRIYAAIPTIKKLRDRGIRIILASHFGRAGDQLSSIRKYIDPIIPNIVYGESWDEYVIRTDLSRLYGSEIYCLPNTRLHPGEESNSSEFAQMLASFADIYINDAFSASHRVHASIVGVPQHVPGYPGFQFAKEVEYLSKLLQPAPPCSVIIGGAKFETKLDLIQSYLGKANKVYVVGALAHALYVAHGLEIGSSKLDTSVDVSEFAHHPSIVVPDYVVVLRDGNATEVSISDVQPADKIVDAGSRWIRSIANDLSLQKTIIWNGPLGWYEGGYDAGTNEVMKILMGLNSYRVIGGGDTVACIPEYYESRVADFISTGGGAMLEYLANGTLPGVQALGM